MPPTALAVCLPVYVTPDCTDVPTMQVRVRARGTFVET